MPASRKEVEVVFEHTVGHELQALKKVRVTLKFEVKEPRSSVAAGIA
jgi:hypothetical protein